MKRRRHRGTPAAAILLAAVLSVAGCGGGGGGDTPAAGAPAAPAPSPSAPPAAPASGVVTSPPASAPVVGTAAPPLDGMASTDTPVLSLTTSAGPGCTLQYSLTASPLLTGADPLFDQQWHLRNTGQNGGTPAEDLRVSAAWAITRGAGVRVAVIDDAVDVLHGDLRPNVVQGASRSYRPGNLGSVYPVPCTADGAHGTAVAGLVAARDGNGIGGAGVAPKASLVGFDALSGGTDVDIADALTRDAGENQIYHNSWGAPDDGALHESGAAFDAAIASGIADGRAGKGSIFVFSAGNGGCYARRRQSSACMDDNANYDRYVNGRGVIAVCAVDDMGKRPHYAEPGAILTVCAPSSGTRTTGITTTAPGDAYRSDFSGTSASSPMVSGVVALMLSVNPSLTWRDVRLILAGTARRNDTDDESWQAPAFGYRFSHRYGFGVADAQAAVQAAATWTSVGGSATQRSCGPYAGAPNRPLRDPLAGGTLQPVADTVAVAGCAISRIEWVEVRFTAPHAYSGDLRLRLTSPNGLVSELAGARTCTGGCGSYADWRFGSVRHLGEPANGGWTLEATDMLADDVGTFEGWSVTFHGR